MGLDSEEIKPANPKGNQPEIFIGRTDAEAETPILWPSDVKSWLTGKRPSFWERLKAGGEGDNRGWDGWMASPTRCTWVWTSSESWWWTGKPGMLQSMGPQRLEHNWASELNWVKNLPAMHEIQFQSPGQEDSPGGGNDSPLQYSCLKNHGQRSLAGYSPWDGKE